MTWQTRATYYHRPVPGGVTVSAAGLLAAGNGDPDRGTVLQVIDVDPDASYQSRWDDDLALRAARRPGADLPPCRRRMGAEARQLHPDVITESVAVPGPDGRMVPVGEAELAAGLERSIHSAPWDWFPAPSSPARTGDAGEPRHCWDRT